MWPQLLMHCSKVKRGEGKKKGEEEQVGDERLERNGAADEARIETSRG